MRRVERVVDAEGAGALGERSGDEDVADEHAGEPVRPVAEDADPVLVGGGADHADAAGGGADDAEAGALLLAVDAEAVGARAGVVPPDRLRPGARVAPPG